MVRRTSMHWVGMALAASVLLALGGCPPVTTTPEGDDNGSNTTPVTKTLHEKIFTDIITDGFTSTSDCVICHSDVARDLFTTGHWKWEGTSSNIVGFETETHGKVDLINNFCIAVPSNEGRCTQCHPSFGWKSNTPASFFDDPANVDCLVCHDTTGTYRKHPSANGGGGPAALLIDGNVQVVTASDLQQVAYQVGKPNRANCGQCHYFAGGGDNVKHGDLASSLNTATVDQDVHMGGQDFSCQTCHTVARHGIAGMALHSVDEGGASPDCTRCHGDTDVHVDNPVLDELINMHLDRVACQTCHIPTFARVKPTKVEWYWSEAGQDINPIPVDALGQQTYDKMKGRFVWAKEVQPTYMWYDGKWERKFIGGNDTYVEAGTVGDPIVLAAPTADANTPGAKIYPFKKMIGDQPVDSVTKRLIVPHLFGTGTGLQNAYWSKYDWKLALEDGTAYAGQPFDSSTWTVENGFGHTVMYLTINHEVAPKAQALQCNDCHGKAAAAFWTGLGIQDPFSR